DRAQLAAAQARINQAQGGLVPVVVTVTASDVCDASPVSRIISITNSESSEVLGGSVTSVTWGTLTGNLACNLQPLATGGAPRVYTRTVQCADSSGNASTGTVTVTVPGGP